MTYYEAKKKPKRILWDYGVKQGYIDKYAQKMGYNYFDKATILEMLSVYLRDWDTKHNRYMSEGG